MNSPGTSPPPAVSILIVNYNGAHLLRPCLDSLRLIKARSFEVVLVDNASGDNSRQVLAEYPEVRVIRSAANLGFAGGNNLGLPHCTGRYVLLLNNDTVVPPGFLQQLTDYLDIHPRVGVVQGKMLLPKHGGCLDVCGSFLTWFGLPYHYGYFKPDGPQYQRSYPVFSGKGACLMFRRDLIAKVGGFLFDDDFFCYYEETDFCHRVWLAGAEVHFVPSEPVLHFMGSTSGAPHADFVLRHYLSNMAFSLSANLGWGSLLLTLPLFYGTLLAGALASILARRWGPLQAQVQAALLPVRQFGKIRRRRRLIAGLRQARDREIFKRIRRTPRPGYFIKTFTAQLASYQDAALD